MSDKEIDWNVVGPELAEALEALLHAADYGRPARLSTTLEVWKAARAALAKARP
jgi:hypothetical protein